MREVRYSWKRSCSRSKGRLRIETCLRAPLPPRRGLQPLERAAED